MQRDIRAPQVAYQIDSEYSIYRGHPLHHDQCYSKSHPVPKIITVPVRDDARAGRIGRADRRTVRRPQAASRMRGRDGHDQGGPDTAHAATPALPVPSSHGYNPDIARRFTNEESIEPNGLPSGPRSA